MGFSIMGIVFATDKHKQLIHSPKAITLAKIGAVIAIILSIIALTGVVLRTGTYYNLLNSLN